MVTIAAEAARQQDQERIDASIAGGQHILRFVQHACDLRIDGKDRRLRDRLRQRIYDSLPGSST
ncbi:hypothetical protein [Teichococcus deserti]|nr:hypothetical protein [Pseudoroseomonas deserti]